MSYYNNGSRKRKFSDRRHEENEQWSQQIHQLALMSGKLKTLYEAEKAGKSVGDVSNIDKQAWTELELLRKLESHVSFVSRNIRSRYQQQKQNFKKQREHSSSPLIGLDTALLCSVLSYSDPKTLICCESTSKSMKEIITNYSLWKTLHGGANIFHQTVDDKLLEHEESSNRRKKQLPESEFRKETRTAYIAQQCEEGCLPAILNDGDIIGGVPRWSTGTTKLFIRLSSSSSKRSILKKKWIVQGYKDVNVKGGNIFHPSLGFAIDLNLLAWPDLMEFVAWWRGGVGENQNISHSRQARHERLLGLLPPDLKITILHGEYPIISTKGIDSFKIRRKNFIFKLVDQNDAFTTLEVGTTNSGLCLKAHKRRHDEDGVSGGEQHQQLDENNFPYKYSDINALSPSSSTSGPPAG